MAIRRSYIDNDVGGQIHLAESGDGEAVLLIHQTPRSWDEFREVMELLGSDMRLVAMDLPGMGASSPASTVPTIESYAAAASQVAEHTGDTPITICGHHTGGVVAIELAATRPDLVKSLVLSSTPWIDAAVRLERSRKTPIDAVRTQADGSHLIELWNQRAPFYPDEPEYLNRFMADALAADDPASGHGAVSAYQMEKAVSKIDCPILLIEHLKDPFAVKHCNDLKAAFPEAEVAQISGGHVALEVTAAQFAQILSDWMQKQNQPAKPIKQGME